MTYKHWIGGAWLLWVIIIVVLMTLTVGCHVHLGERHYHYDGPETAAARASPEALIDKIFSNAGDEPAPREK